MFVVCCSTSVYETNQIFTMQKLRDMKNKRRKCEGNEQTNVDKICSFIVVVAKAVAR